MSSVEALLCTEAGFYLSYTHCKPPPMQWSPDCGPVSRDASISVATSHRRICSLTDSRTPVATNRQRKSPFPLTAWQTEVKANVGKRWMVMEKQWGWRVQRLVGKPVCDLHHHGNPDDGYTDFILFFFLHSSCSNFLIASFMSVCAYLCVYVRLRESCRGPDVPNCHSGSIHTGNPCRKP